MQQSRPQPDSDEPDWHRLLPLAELERKQVRLLRIEGKQIAVFATADGIRACDNRCPHEGYPLSEGSLSPGCILTCNWHNWKFDLNSGENLYGGDKLRIYPVEIRGEDVWVNIAEQPYRQRYAAAVGSLRDAFDDYSYDRIAREIARLTRIGADPIDVLRLAIEWSWQRMEFGWTHAYAGMADWLLLYDEHPGDAEIQLVCLVESVAHAAFDVLRERDYAFTPESTPFDAARFAEDIEAENEDAAVAAVRGGIRDGLCFADFEPALTRAALRHYNDFGHALIYLTKAEALIDRLGESVMEPLLLSLVREMIYAWREDKVPEFRAYGELLQQWGRQRKRCPDPAMWWRKGINQSMKAVLACSGNAPLEIYRALLLANARNLLCFDLSQQDKVRVPVSGNVGWLDFTHGLTFANAVRRQCSRFPELWPQGLLQMACFNGRNAGFTVAELDPQGFRPEDSGRKLEELLQRVLDHGQGEHIVAVHLLKTALAVRAEAAQLDTADAEILVAALTRFFDSPLKRRQARRTAYQSLKFVSKD